MKQIFSTELVELKITLDRYRNRSQLGVGIALTQEKLAELIHKADSENKSLSDFMCDMLENRPSDILNWTDLFIIYDYHENSIMEYTENYCSIPCEEFFSYVFHRNKLHRKIKEAVDSGGRLMDF